MCLDRKDSTMSHQPQALTPYWQPIVTRKLVVLDQGEGRSICVTIRLGVERQCTGKQMRIPPFPLPTFLTCPSRLYFYRTCPRINDSQMLPKFIKAVPPQMVPIHEQALPRECMKRAFQIAIANCDGRMRITIATAE